MTIDPPYLSSGLMISISLCSLLLRLFIHPSTSLFPQIEKIYTFIMAKQTAILTGEASSPLLFRHVLPGPGDSTMQFRLLHHWEARKNVKGGPGILLGIEMLMIDEEVY